ncbi:MAG TPA: hypothetical protein VFN94_06025 [Nitrospiria bacterium]|nr:hypothetical protein [Nitrospiria bacterium]
MYLAAAHNPVIRPEAVIERTVVGDGVGLLVGEEEGRTTLLYLWWQERPDFLAWMAHVARWTSLSPTWRKAQGLKASDVPIRVILAVPSVSEGLRDAVTLLSPSVTVLRYRWEARGGACALRWDEDSATVCSPAGDRVGGATPAGIFSSASADEALTPEERDFFQQFA